MFATSQKSRQGVQQKQVAINCSRLSQKKLIDFVITYTRITKDETKTAGRSESPRVRPNGALSVPPLLDFFIDIFSEHANFIASKGGMALNNSCNGSFSCGAFFPLVLSLTTKRLLTKGLSMSPLLVSIRRVFVYLPSLGDLHDCV